MNFQSLNFMKRFIFGFILIFSVNQLSAQIIGPHVVLEKVTDNVYMFSGYWGNVTVLTSDEGMLFVDSKNNILVDTMITEMKKVCNQPVRYLINTHWHRDHVGGNEKMAEYGAKIIAHENVLKRVSTEQEIKFFDRKYSPLPESAFPVTTFTEEFNMNFYGNTIDVIHMKGHTDGDAVIFFKEANVVVAGDIYFEGLYPYIGISSGGSINYMIESAERILAMINNETIVIPGHGPISNKDLLTEYTEMLTNIRNEIQRQIRIKKPLQSIIDSKPTKKYDAKWGKEFILPDKFVELVYLDLTGTYKVE